MQHSASGKVTTGLLVMQYKLWAHDLQDEHQVLSTGVSHVYPHKEYVDDIPDG